MVSGANSSVSEEAIASSSGFSRTKLTYAPTAKRVAGSVPASEADVGPIEAQAFGEDEPARDAAVPFAIAVVIDDTLAPDATHGGVGHARKDDRILDRDDCLIAIAIEGPGLQLPAVQATRIHHVVKRMLVMVARSSQCAQPVLELAGRKQRGQRVSSMPS